MSRRTFVLNPGRPLAAEKRPYPATSCLPSNPLPSSAASHHPQRPATKKQQPCQALEGPRPLLSGPPWGRQVQPAGAPNQKAAHAPALRLPPLRPAHSPGRNAAQRPHSLRRGRPLESGAHSWPTTSPSTCCCGRLKSRPTRYQNPSWAQGAHRRLSLYARRSRVRKATARRRRWASHLAQLPVRLYVSKSRDRTGP